MYTTFVLVLAEAREYQILWNWSQEIISHLMWFLETESESSVRKAGVLNF